MSDHPHHEFTLIGTDDLTGERYARTAPDADACLRENIEAHMDVWNSTIPQVAAALGLDEAEFARFMAGERSADLSWVTRLAAYTYSTPAQVLVCQTANAHRNVLAHLELIAEGDDLQSMLETLVIAKRSGLLPTMLKTLGSLSDTALAADGEDPERLRSLVRRVAGANAN